MSDRTRWPNTLTAEQLQESFARVDWYPFIDNLREIVTEQAQPQHSTGQEAHCDAETIGTNRVEVGATGGA